jgi:predicted HTH transcriptional regulator
MGDLCQRKPERSRKSRHKSKASSALPVTVAISDDQNPAKNVPNDVPNQIDTSSCNIRQLWFINTLLEGEKVFATDIAAHWRVTAKTAKRDITGLKSAGLIVYQGTRRSGFYELAREPEGDG